MVRINYCFVLLFPLQYIFASKHLVIILIIMIFLLAIWACLMSSPSFLACKHRCDRGWSCSKIMGWKLWHLSSNPWAVVVVNLVIENMIICTWNSLLPKASPSAPSAEASLSASNPRNREYFNGKQLGGCWDKNSITAHFWLKILTMWGILSFVSPY